MAISALKKEGIDDLLDAILLQAEILELKANYTCRAEGKVIESRIDHGRGVVCTVIVERGTLRVGDPFVGGIYSGHVKAIFNDRGVKIPEATPSTPVEIMGFEGMPNAGDPFQVTESERDARDISAKRQELKRFEDSKAVKKVNLDNLYDTIEQGEVMELKVIIKADVQGSAEAVKSSLEKISNEEVRVRVIHSAVGAINESDVMLAATSNAIIVGFNVRPDSAARDSAARSNVDIRLYRVIYDCINEIQDAMKGMLAPKFREQIIGHAEVRETYKVSKVGTVCGCYCTDGKIQRGCEVRVLRDNIVIHEGSLASLRRFKDDVREVAAGYECGMQVEKFNDIKIGDVIECFVMEQIAD